MIEFGIPDPTNVTRAAPQNAAAITGLMITKEPMVTEALEAKLAGHGRRWRLGWHGLLIQPQLHKMRNRKHETLQRAPAFVCGSQAKLVSSPRPAT